MKIGITYDLRSEYLNMGFTEDETAEFDQESTIEAIESTLNALHFKAERVGNVRQLATRLVKGYRWDLIFNISEGMYGNGREAQVPALLDTYQIPYVFSSPLVLALTLDKAFTKRIVRDAGIATPDFVIIKNPDEVDSINLVFPLFAKPVAEGTGKGINGASVIYNKKELKERCNFLLTEYRQAVLIEQFLPGREFTVGIVGTGKNSRAVGTMEVRLKDNAEKNVYSYVNKEECESLIEYVPVKGKDKEACESLALETYRLLECEDAGRVDLRMDANGTPNFMEINPLAGLHPEHSDLPILSRLNGISYKKLMKMIMDSAITKVKNKVVTSI